MKSQKPISSFTKPDGTTVLKNANGDEIGTIKDPQDADEIVERVNCGMRDRMFGGNTQFTTE